MDLAHRQGNPLLGLLPREHAHFGVWREHRGLHGDRIRMHRNVIRQDQYGVWQLRTKSRVTVKTKSAPVTNMFVIYCSTTSMGMSGRRLTKSGAQPVLLMPYIPVGILRPEPDGLRQNARDHAIGCPLQKIPDEWAADAEAHHHELIDAQMIHQTELVIGV